MPAATIQTKLSARSVKALRDAAGSELNVVGKLAWFDATPATLGVLRNMGLLERCPEGRTQDILTRAGQYTLAYINN